MSDYVPKNDVELDVFQSNLLSIIKLKYSEWGIPEEDMNNLIPFHQTWSTAFGKTINRQNRTAIDVQAKDDARDALVRKIREFYGQWLAKNLKISNSEREQLGLPVRMNGRSVVPAPSTFPVGAIDFSVLRRHSISFTDTDTPNSKAKPEGMHGCEIWMKLGNESPKSDTEFIYQGVCTRQPYIKNFNDEDTGKKAYYRLRWVNSKGETGPFSRTISALVVGE